MIYLIYVYKVCSGSPLEGSAKKAKLFFFPWTPKLKSHHCWFPIVRRSGCISAGALEPKAQGAQVTHEFVLGTQPTTPRPYSSSKKQNKERKQEQAQKHKHKHKSTARQPPPSLPPPPLSPHQLVRQDSLQTCVFGTQGRHAFLQRLVRVSMWGGIHTGQHVGRYGSACGVVWVVCGMVRVSMWGGTG